MVLIIREFTLFQENFRFLFFSLNYIKEPVIIRTQSVSNLCEFFNDSIFCLDKMLFVRPFLDFPRSSPHHTVTDNHIKIDVAIQEILIFISK